VVPEVTKSADLLNVALMIFVNELAKVKGLPWWTYHAPGKIDAMTYVDGFLFILGMAIPLALQARIKKATTFPQFSDTDFRTFRRRVAPIRTHH
jgi:hypothetical protein